MTMKKNTQGVTVMLVMVYMGVFAMVVTMLASYLLVQSNVGRAKYAREQALNIAEAGLEYYKWFLAHNPNNLTNGTGQPGPYTYTVDDPEGGTIGSASISITGNSACGIVQSVDINSQGTSNADTRFKRTLIARYMRPSVAEYSNLLNANVWAGADRVITGPYFSNGGIRMDGTNNSTVRSAVSTWTCTSSFGCSPNQSKAGVWGAGSGSALWQYPVPNFDFAGIATNFATLQGYANTSGILLAPTLVKVAGVQQGGTFASVGGTDQRGFRIVLRSDDTIDVYRVTGTTGVQSVHVDNPTVWMNDYDIISNETYQGRYTLPSGCPLIFAQAKVWLQGVVGSKVTVVAADVGSYTPDIIVNNDITYNSGTGSSGLTAIAERSVLIPLVSPDTMTMRGIFVAQSGYLGRNYYTSSGSHAVPSAYSSYVTQSQLTTFGSVVSNGRVGTKWTCGGTFCSGYNNRIDTYDRLLAFSPPPFTPNATTDFKFVMWREQ
ncbi:hypothetical protein HY413_03145 [Candidatus Kaiserbacteria bacterium]|nr:hypothetical protein [Candidatus Kaiserbacteria bacterium]